MRHFRALALIPVTALSGALVSMPVGHAAVDNHLSLVSVATPEVFPDANGSFTRAISDDGRFVLFASSQPNIVLGDEADPAGRYLYLRDLQSGTTTRLSHGPGGNLMSNAAISADGGYVTFASDEGDGQSALRLYNRSTNTTTVISKPPAAEDTWYTVAISDDARYVFYTRTQIAGEDFETKLYRYAVQTGVTDRPISGKIGTLQNADSATIPSSSANGRYLTFVQSLAPAEEVSFYRLVRLDTSTGTKTVIGKSLQAEGIPQNAFGDPSMSNSGRYIAYTKQVPESSVHVYVYDATSGTSKLVSHKAGSPGTEANDSAFQPHVSGNGRYVAFVSAATNIVAGVPAVETIFVYNRQSGTAEAFVKNRQGVYPGSRLDSSSLPYIDGDGSTVAFTSHAQGLSAGARSRLERVYAWQRP
jgi:dipeptidyl aminopeptidase/acylaminoacyl peptidase